MSTQISTQNVYTGNTLDDLKKENLITLVLSLQVEREKLKVKFGELIGNLTNTLDDLSSKLNQVHSSLVVTKTINDSLLKCIASLRRSYDIQEQYTRR